MKRFIYLSIVFFFTPLESSVIYGGDAINESHFSIERVGFKAPFFLTGFTTPESKKTTILYESLINIAVQGRLFPIDRKFVFMGKV